MMLPGPKIPFTGKGYFDKSAMDRLKTANGRRLHDQTEANCLLQMNGSFSKKYGQIRERPVHRCDGKDWRGLYLLGKVIGHPWSWTASFVDAASSFASGVPSSVHDGLS